MQMVCGTCGSSDVAKKGVRYNATGAKQKFFCHNCKRWFVDDDGFKRMRHKPNDITRALDEYADGASLKKVQKRLLQHDGIKVTRWTIRNWVVKYSHLLKKPRRDLAYQRLRAASMSAKNT